MKLRPSFFVILLISVGLEAICQTHADLKIPQDWTVEKFTLPPSFAPEFPFTGTEEVIFSPEWAKKGSHGYWSYCYKWTLTGYPTLNRQSLQHALTIYYTKLVTSNLKVANIDPAFAIPVEVSLVPQKENRNSYTGTVKMLDYMTQDPIALNIRIKQTAGKTFFTEISPKPYKDVLWTIMDGINN